MSNISVILNVYNRPDTLDKQINAVLNQSVKIEPENIHVWYNKSDKQQFFPKNKKINTYIANWNTKFFGRFTLPLLCRTEYIAMFDDDILPEKDWLKNCMDSMNKQEGIYGGSGVILKAKA
jgi:glycosyltransferase involved in cell wall biosynthesis